MKKIFFILSMLLILISISCQNSVSPTTTNIVVDSPSFNPPAGEFSDNIIKIGLTTKTEGSDIYYTLDGTEPTVKSNKYSGEFSIQGTKVVKAIAVKNGLSSAISTANYKLNVGKSSSQMGAIHGRVSLSDNLSEATKTKVKNDTIYIFSSDLPGIVKKTKIGEEYSFDGLDTSKTYSFFFTNKEPGNIVNSRSISREAVATDNPIVATVVENQQPVEGAGLNIDATLKITGKIRGVAVRYDVSGNKEQDNSGSVVFIPGTSYSAFTDKDGKFEISGIPQGTYTVRAQYPTYIAQEIESVMLQNTDTSSTEEPIHNINKKFELYYGQGNIKGVAILEGAGAAENSGVNVVITDSDNNHSYNASTTVTGNWGVTDIYPGTYSIEYSKDGYSPIITGNIKVYGAKTTEVKKVELQIGGCSVSGNVVLKDNKDNSGIQLLLKKIPTKTDSKEMSYYGLTDNNGNFSIYNVMPGTYTIVASYPGFISVEENNINLIKGTNFTGLKLPVMGKKTTSISGKVILEGLTSFEGSSVVLIDIKTNKQLDSATTGKDGTYIFNNIVPGEYLISASHDGYLTSTGTNVTISTNGNIVADDITLNTAQGKIKGIVKLESNTDYSGISVLLSSDETDKTYNTTTDAEGSYSFAGIEPGMWKVQVTKNGYITKYSDPFTVTSGKLSVPNDLFMKISMRSIYGNVSLEGRTDFTGIKITATNTKNPSEIYSALTNKDGFFALTGMTPSEYVLSYAFDNYVTYTSSSINVLNDNTLQLPKVDLKKATGSITGIVNLEGCTDHSGIKVELVGTDKTYTTGIDGKYDFLVPSGNYPGGVRFTKEDYTTTAQADTITVLTDSTYGVTTVEMTATASTLRGTIDLLGSQDDSGITVTIDGIDSSVCSATTDVDGNWTMYHVPLGFRVIRFTKLNVPDMTSETTVIPANFNEIGKLEMIPDSATLKGYVYLDGMTDNSNITVTVTNDGKPDLVATTTSDGAFEVNNILASGSHTITFSKDGWDSQSITMNDFTPLETRTIGTNRKYVLKDTTKPQLNSIVINEGANFTNSPKLNVKIDALELGSGIEKMAVQVKAPNYDTIYPAEPNWQDYKVSYVEDLLQLPKQVYTGNGEYTLYIKLKDKAGNISEIVSDSITVTDQVSILRGVLKGSDLHLRKANSPYRVESNILVEEGTTLVIDPGVQIEFADDYVLKVDGEINAIGKNEDKIIFNASNYNPSKTWKGIVIGTTSKNVKADNKFNYIDGNIFKYCEISNARYPINNDGARPLDTGNFYLDNSIIDKNCLNPIIVGSDNTYVLNSFLNSGLKVPYRGENSNGYIINNIIINNIFLEYFTGNVVSNTIKDAEISIKWCFNGTIQKNIFDNVFINLETYDTYDNANGKIILNNFINCPNLIINAKGANTGIKEYCFQQNYWGKSNTEELQLVGLKNDTSFIYDYYDDFNLAYVNYSNWATQPIENCGSTLK